MALALTTEETAAELALLIADFRYTRGTPAQKLYYALKAARDAVLAGTPQRIGEVQRELASSLDALEASKITLGYRMENLQDVAFKTRRYWPTIRRGLEALEKETTQ